MHATFRVSHMGVGLGDLNPRIRALLTPNQLCAVQCLQHLIDLRF